MSEASNRRKKPDPLAKIGADFQSEMRKLGVAVSIQAGDGPMHTVTAFYCPDCKVQRNFDAEAKGEIGKRKWEPCVCGSANEPVLA